jgi:hypothetical protein
MVRSGFVIGGSSCSARRTGEGVVKLKQLVSKTQDYYRQ